VEVLDTVFMTFIKVGWLPEDMVSPLPGWLIPPCNTKDIKAVLQLKSVKCVFLLHTVDPPLKARKPKKRRKQPRAVRGMEWPAITVLWLPLSCRDKLVRGNSVQVQERGDYWLDKYSLSGK